MKASDLQNLEHQKDGLMCKKQKVEQLRRNGGYREKGGDGVRLVDDYYEEKIQEIIRDMEGGAMHCRVRLQGNEFYSRLVVY